MINICQVLPLKSGIESIEAQRIIKFNEMVYKKFKSKKKVQIVPFYDRITAIDNYSDLFFNEVHLDRAKGRNKTLISCLTEKILQFSNLKCNAVNKHFRFNNVQIKHSFSNRVTDARRLLNNNHQRDFKRGPVHPKSLPTNRGPVHSGYNYAPNSDGHYYDHQTYDYMSALKHPSSRGAMRFDPYAQF